MDITPQKLQGFSLFELVIVLVVISILWIFTYFSLQDITNNLEGQAQQIANDIRYAQSLSMTRGQRYRWVRASATTYQILNASGSPVTMIKGNTTVTLNSAISFGTLTNLPSNLIAFDGLGTPYIDTALPGTALSSTANITLTAGGQTKTIIISPGTGRVSVQ
jgi:prepilin-type N-terminal cleavage/methylation domain-containing protein